MASRTAQILLAVFMLTVTHLAVAQDEVIEEIVVTGSYIKRDNFDLPSPMKLINQDELKAEATPALGEVIGNQTFSYGTDMFANLYTANGQTGSFTAANFRGLGTRATLNLIDGKRVLNNNLNAYCFSNII